MRLVAIRPGTTMLLVMLRSPTPRARVLLHPTRLDLSALDRPRFGMGTTTPLEVLVMMRPHLRSRIPGSTASVMAMTETTMLVKNRVQSSGRCPDAWVGGGPPVIFTMISIGPSCRSTVAMLGPIALRSARSQGTATASVIAPTRSAAAVRLSLGRLARAILAPSAANVSAMTPPRPALAPKTRATLLFSCRSTASLLFELGSIPQPDRGDTHCQPPRHGTLQESVLLMRGRLVCR